MAQSWFSIKNKGETAEIDIFDEIGFWGVSAKTFVDQLRALGSPKSITLNIDCPGGDCNDGFTIYDAIKATGANVTANITGLAASMASVIMLAAKKITIAENGRVMIHRVTTGAYGNADDVDAAAKVARQFEDRIVNLYMERTGKDEAAVRDWMKAAMGTWFFGKEAVENGFADSVVSGSKARAFQTKWAGMFTMLPAALFDTKRNSTTENFNPPIMTEAELIAAQEKLAADQAKLAADQKALTDLAAEQADKAKTEAPAALKKEDLTAAIAEAVKPLNAELETLKAAIKSGVAGAAGGRSAVDLNNKDEADVKTITRAAFNKLNSKEQHAHCKAGGRITD
jgi:ATP-dependent Clp endopeptidase proteolytic subunit ClpP